jgi:hypothetical protein
VAFLDEEVVDGLVRILGQVDRGVSCSRSSGEPLRGRSSGVLMPHRRRFSSWKLPKPLSMSATTVSPSITRQM